MIGLTRHSCLNPSVVRDIHKVVSRSMRSDRHVRQKTANLGRVICRQRESECIQ